MLLNKKVLYVESGAERDAPSVERVACVEGGRTFGFGRPWVTGMRRVREVVSFWVGPAAAVLRSRRRVVRRCIVAVVTVMGVVVRLDN